MHRRRSSIRSVGYSTGGTKRLEEELQRAIRQLTSVGLLMVDLDGFKSINDRFGHVAGDLVIRDISEILRRSVQSLMSARASAEKNSPS